MYSETEQCIFDVITTYWPTAAECVRLLEHYQGVISIKAYNDLMELINEILLAEIAALQMRGQA